MNINKDKIIIKTKDYNKEIFNKLLKDGEDNKIAYFISQREELFNAMNYNNEYENIAMKDAKELAIKLDKILKNEPEKLVIYTDYDNDGYSGGFIVLDFIKEKYGIDVDFQINDRFKEGYGININVIDRLHEKGYKYILTTDLGISSIEQIDKAVELGMEVFITDHHLPKVDDDGKESLPKASLIVNAQIDGNNYEKGVCGAYTIWHVLQFIDKKLAKNYIDIVALALLSDNMPLNKGLVRQTVIKGIEKINRNDISNKFVEKIINEHKKKNNKNQITEMDLGFYIVPLINAVGRLDSVSNLMKWTLNNELEQYDYVKELNEKRKEMTSQYTEIAYEKAKVEVEEKHNNIIIIEFEDCPEGIIGLIASRICEKYKKPTLVATLDETKTRYKASGRSKDNYDFSKFFADEKIKYIIEQRKDSDDENDKENLLKKLKNKKELTKEENALVVGGGHKYACGMSFFKKNLKILKDRLREIDQPENYQIEVEVIISKENEEKKLKIDLSNEEFEKIIKKKFNIPFIQSYNKVLSPFGQQNEEPTFVLIGNSNKPTFLGKEEKHVKFELNGINCISFNTEQTVKDLIFDKTKKIVVIGSFSINEFRGKKSIQFMVKDLYPMDKVELK